MPAVSTAIREGAAEERGRAIVEEVNACQIAVDDRAVTVVKEHHPSAAAGQVAVLEVHGSEEAAHNVWGSAEERRAGGHQVTIDGESRVRRVDNDSRVDREGHAFIDDDGTGENIR